MHMTITKFGHCCLLVETSGKRIVVDPGRFSDEQNTLANIDIILITHEHADHCHSDSITQLLTNNPEAIVVTNTSVAKILETLGIDSHILEGRDRANIVDVTLEAFDGEHVEIFEDFGLVQNTGYFVDDEFFFPGDAYTIPDKPIQVLALPVAGPWCKVADAIRYAISVKPTSAFPVHDATLNEAGKAVTYPHFERELQKYNISFVTLETSTPVVFEGAAN
jgi:L-ascorbate metabolism protein UlaG (beta-lactamase superfamily)